MILFEYSDDYARKFGDIAEIKLSDRLFPDQMIRGWEWVIEQIEKGYDENIYELDYDLSCYREPIEEMISDDELDTFSEHQEFKKFISELDHKFLELTQVNPRVESLDDLKWWEKRLLKYGKEIYREHLEEEQKILVKIIE
ncbi:MAG TPA: hypothetical protein VIM07_15840 [Chitinophagaceae bacterium]